MIKQLTFLAVLAFFGLPFLVASKNCITDDDCGACKSYQRICMQKKCEKGDRYIALLTSAGSIGFINPTQSIFDPKVTLSGAIAIGVASDNIAYATTGVELYACNFDTKTTTLVGAFPYPLDGGVMGGGPDGLLYINTPAPFPQPGSILYTIDPATANVLSSVPVPGFSRDGGDLAWIPSLNAFYANDASTGEFYRITLGGVATRIGNLNREVFALGYYRGTLYGFDTGEYQLIIDPLTADVTVDKHIENLDGIIWSSSR